MANNAAIKYKSEAIPVLDGSSRCDYGVRDQENRIDCRCVNARDIWIKGTSWKIRIVIQDSNISIQWRDPLLGTIAQYRYIDSGIFYLI